MYGRSNAIPGGKMEGGRQETRVAELGDGSMRAYYPV